MPCRLSCSGSQVSENTQYFSIFRPFLLISLFNMFTGVFAFCFLKNYQFLLLKMYLVCSFSEKLSFLALKNVLAVHFAKLIYVWEYYINFCEEVQWYSAPLSQVSFNLNLHVRKSRSRGKEIHIRIRNGFEVIGEDGMVLRLQGKIESRDLNIFRGHSSRIHGVQPENLVGIAVEYTRVLYIIFLVVHGIPGKLLKNGRILLNIPQVCSLFLMGGYLVFGYERRL